MVNAHILFLHNLIFSVQLVANLLECPSWRSIKVFCHSALSSRVRARLLKHTTSCRMCRFRCWGCGCFSLGGFTALQLCWKLLHESTSKIQRDFLYIFFIPRLSKQFITIINGEWSEVVTTSQRKQTAWNLNFESHVFKCVLVKQLSKNHLNGIQKINGSNFCHDSNSIRWSLQRCKSWRELGQCCGARRKMPRHVVALCKCLKGFMRKRRTVEKNARRTSATSKMSALSTFHVFSSIFLHQFDASGKPKRLSEDAKICKACGKRGMGLTRRGNNTCFFGEGKQPVWSGQ